MLSDKNLVIGIDLDNTIAIYDDLIVDSAKEIGVPLNVLTSKQSVANYLRSVGRESDWTYLQGLIYGPYMKTADVADGFFDAFENINQENINISIISHRTAIPSSGLDFNLHDAAKDWVSRKIISSNKMRGIKVDLHLAETQEEKINTISRVSPFLFVDDLLHILENPKFPPNVKKVYYCREKIYINNVTPLLCWKDFGLLLGAMLSNYET